VRPLVLFSDLNQAARKLLRCMQKTAVASKASPQMRHGDNATCTKVNHRSVELSCSSPLTLNDWRYQLQRLVLPAADAAAPCSSLLGSTGESVVAEMERKVRENGPSWSPKKLQRDMNNREPQKWNQQTYLLIMILIRLVVLRLIGSACSFSLPR